MARPHHGEVNTIRLPALARTERRAWGSTDWAAHSCLAEWSTLERQWLGLEERQAARVAARRRLRKRFLVGLMIAGAGAVGLTPALQQVVLGVMRSLGPVIGWLADALPLVALTGGVLVLAGVALGLWREPVDERPTVAPQTDAADDGAG